ncbi:MAG TPA: homoserine dehydrogenase [Terriglobales bacterium]|nr:homoserine dehydrogenase [Terriglobales bacterium]
MRAVPIALTGFGHVSRAFVTLLREKSSSVERRYALRFDLMAVVKAGGCLFSGEPLAFGRQLKEGGTAVESHSAWREGMGLGDLLRGAGGGGCLVECTPSDLRTGEPGLPYIVAALENDWNVATAGKGALVVAFQKLRALAAGRGLALRFSGATAAALPTLDVGLVSLAGAAIEGIQGILNGTSNYVLTKMAEGLTYGSALQEAQRWGIAEPDPSMDVGGWDSAAKLLLIANSCLDTDYALNDVRVTGIDGLPAAFAGQAAAEGKSVKLLASASPAKSGRGWTLEVRPSLLDASHPLFHVSGTEKGITFTTDTMGPVTLTGGRSSARGAAAALLKDLINIYRDRF